MHLSRRSWTRCALRRAAIPRRAAAPPRRRAPLRRTTFTPLSRRCAALSSRPHSLSLAAWAAAGARADGGGAPGVPHGGRRHAVQG
eukprot:1765615-Prymnesium_polylepis.1